ncbi:hypothetical protein LCGC14_2898300 [marine sediment metagenome]|uniref:Uncharacterized protein n=1 Tax=marine sediment metagenome TaxID=412755 RepID=A0A0F8YH18_9ZZZZ
MALGTLNEDIIRTSFGCADCNDLKEGFKHQSVFINGVEYDVSTERARRFFENVYEGVGVCDTTGGRIEIPVLSVDYYNKLRQLLIEEGILTDDE